MKKIKIGIIAFGGAFILIAIIYIAAVAGGRNKEIEQAQEQIVQAIPTEAPVEEEVVTPTPTEEVVVEEEMPAESLLDVAQGNARYDDCVYADGGVVIVRKGDKFGAIDYEGKEIVSLKYSEVSQIPTKEGMFVLSVSKTENVTEEKDGTTYSYENTVTTYTLFSSSGKELYKGNNKVVASNDTLIMAIEDINEPRNTRVEYSKIGANKPFLTLYVNDQFSLNGFMDGFTTVMGFTAIPTEDQDTNPTNLVAGTMDEKGKLYWFAKAPGMDAFNAKVSQWKEDNKALITSINNSKKKIEEESEEEVQEEEEEILYDEEGNPIEPEEDEEEDEDIDEEVDEESEETEPAQEELDMSNGPVFYMDEILNAPVGGFFIYKDLYDVEDAYSWYTDKGLWYADLDVAYLEPDAKKGFRVGNFNNGAVKAKGFVMDGEVYYNFGSMMVLTIGDKDVLIDMSKAKGMKADSITDKIVIAVYDEINISQANSWMYKDGNNAGYLDLKGQPYKFTFEDATSFVNGYALAIKDGKAILINDKFEEVEEIGAAKSVSVEGDIFSVNTDNGIRRYILKETRSNPVATSDLLNATADSKSDDADKAAETKKTTKKKK